MRHWPWKELEPGGYGVIAADPAWHFETRTEAGEGRSPQAHYDTMSLEEICALPVMDLARPDCVLALWCSSPFLLHGLSTLHAWGFTYAAMAGWGKQTKDGERFKTGTGYVVGSTMEVILLGTRGRPPLPGNSASNLIAADRPFPGDGDLLCAPRPPIHSRKPDGFHEWVERHYRGPYCELFARRSERPGWSFWGNQADKFNGGRG